MLRGTSVAIGDQRNIRLAEAEELNEDIEKRPTAKANITRFCKDEATIRNQQLLASNPEEKIP